MADPRNDVGASLNSGERVNRLNNMELNIAITGAAGTGKSTLVNAIRGVSDTDQGAAPTGETETTTKITPYLHPTMPDVKIWDLPGIGTKKFKAKTYLKDVQFQNYDFFIIVSEKRFREYDIMLAKKILKKKRKKRKNFYFVRSMIDQDVASAARREIKEDDALQRIRKDCEENLTEVGSPPVFLISSFHKDKFDFQELQNALERDLPKIRQIKESNRGVDCCIM